MHREGALVSVECTGRVNIRQFMKEITEKDVIRFWCYLMEWNMQKLALLSRKHSRIVSMIQVCANESCHTYE